MRSGFDRGVNRISTNSVKWDAYKGVFNTELDNVLPMWVADMDFEPGEFITEAINKRLTYGNLGYSTFNEYYDAVIQWMKKRYDWDINKECIIYTPGIVTAINFLLKISTEKGDKVLVQSPVYHVFYKVIETNQCEVVENELILNKERRYEIDFDDFEEKIASGVKVFILCSPHNPVGRVWTKDELIKIVKICRKYNTLIISDEIHGDLTFKNITHTPLAKIDKEYLDNIVVCTAPSKSFNMAALYTSNIIIYNEELRAKYQKLFSVQPNILGSEAVKAAYGLGEKWLEEVKTYIEENYKFLKGYFENNIPKLKVTNQEGTFLVWIDCRELNLSDSELNIFFLEKCKIALNQGSTFGKGGSGFVRMNIGCPKIQLEKALKRIRDEIEKI